MPHTGSALDIAYAELAHGVLETNGHNRSPVIDAYNKFVGAALGSPWCAAGLVWCFYQAGARHPQPTILKTASSQALKRWGKDNGWFFTEPNQLLACRGAIFGWTNSGDPGHGHIGFVAQRFTIGKNVAAIGTLEFNTNKAGSRDGDGLYERRRRVPVDGGHALWFIDTTALGNPGQWWAAPTLIDTSTQL